MLLKFAWIVKQRREPCKAMEDGLDRETLKSMRVENPRTNGEKMLNDQIDDLLMEPWRRLFLLALAIIAVAALVAIALK